MVSWIFFQAHNFPFPSVRINPVTEDVFTQIFKGQKSFPLHFEWHSRLFFLFRLSVKFYCLLKWQWYLISLLVLLDRFQSYQCFICTSTTVLIFGFLTHYSLYYGWVPCSAFMVRTCANFLLIVSFLTHLRPHQAGFVSQCKPPIITHTRKV